jgi:hypothetical protein
LRIVAFGLESGNAVGDEGARECFESDDSGVPTD